MGGSTRPVTRKVTHRPGRRSGTPWDALGRPDDADPPPDRKMRSGEFWSGSGAMSPLIEDNLEAIGRLCRLYSVCKLELFGSILRQDFDPEHSDVDLFVEFEPRAADNFPNFLDLNEALEELLERPVDLVELRTIRSRRLRHHVEQSKSSVAVRRPLASGAQPQ